MSCHPTSSSSSQSDRASFSNTHAMSILEKLWDDTLAGPRPESGLGKLRKHNTFSFTQNAEAESDGERQRSYGEESSKEPKRVTRSIMIVKPTEAGYDNGSPPVSPAAFTPPFSPSSGREPFPFRFRRRSTSDADAREKA